MSKVAKEIRDIREHLDMTQIDFALHLGVSRSTICRYEAAQVLPSTETCLRIIKMASAFGVKVKLEDLWEVMPPKPKKVVVEEVMEGQEINEGDAIIDGEDKAE